MSNYSSTSETIKIHANKIKYLRLNNSNKMFDIRNNYIFNPNTYQYGIKIDYIKNDSYDFVIANNYIVGWNYSNNYNPIYFARSFNNLNSVKIMNNYLSCSYDAYGDYAIGFGSNQDNVLISNNITNSYFNSMTNFSYFGENNVYGSDFINDLNTDNGVVGSPTLSSDNGFDAASFMDIDGSINDIGVEGGPYSIRNYYFDDESLGKARIIDLDLPSELFYSDSLNSIIINSKGVHINE